MSSSSGCGSYGLWSPCHSLDLDPQIVLHNFLGLPFLNKGEVNSGRCWLYLWCGFSNRETLPWSSGWAGCGRRTDLFSWGLLRHHLVLNWWKKWGMWPELENGLWAECKGDEGCEYCSKQLGFHGIGHRIVMASISSKLSRNCGLQRCSKH